MFHALFLVGALILGTSASPTPDQSGLVNPAVAPVPITDTAEPLSRPLGAEDMNWFADYLRLLLHEDPWSENQAPLLYVESNDLENDGGGGNMEKRSRYYRRYPWKRVTSRSRNAYDPDAYLCNPSREDVFQLLLALHEAREGNAGRTINFCNRRRPASAVFTNIRFIGRK